LGCIALAENAYGDAEHWLHDSAIVFRKIGKRDGLSYTLAALACVACRSSQPDPARQHIGEALETAVETQFFGALMFSLPATALLISGQGETARAVELYALASRYSFVANSRWFEDVVGRHIAAAATALPPKVIAEAQERGRAQDITVAMKELSAEFGSGSRCSAL
jgi:hypothetical protein